MFYKKFKKIHPKQYFIFSLAYFYKIFTFY